MNRPNYMQEMKDRIEAAKVGSVFVASDFADITETKRIKAYDLIKRFSEDNYCEVFISIVKEIVKNENGY